MREILRGTYSSVGIKWCCTPLADSFGLRVMAYHTTPLRHLPAVHITNISVFDACFEVLGTAIIFGTSVAGGVNTKLRGSPPLVDSACDIDLIGEQGLVQGFVVNKACKQALTNQYLDAVLGEERVLTKGKYHGRPRSC